MAKNQTEITYNIFRKIKATRTFRNIFITLSVVSQVAGTILVFVAWEDYTGHILQYKTYWTVYGSCIVSISIFVMFFGYLAGFII